MKDDLSGITSSDVISSSRSTVLSLLMWNNPPDGYGPKTSNGSKNQLFVSDNIDISSHFGLNSATWIVAVCLSVEY